MRPYVWALIALMYAPMAVVVAQSFNASPVPYLWGGFTLQWYAKLAGWAEAWRALLNSLAVAAAVAAASALLGLAMAYSLRGDRYLAASQVAIVMPEVTEALAFAAFLTLLDRAAAAVDPRATLFGPVGVTLAHLAYTLPTAHVLLAPYMAYLSPNLVQAARLLGASEARAFLSVVLPVMAPAAAAAFLVAFASSFDTYVKTAFATAPGFQTAPMLLWSYAARGRGDPALYALAAVMLAPSLAAAAIYHRAIRRFSP